MSEKNHSRSYLTAGETAAAARLTDRLCLCGAAVKSNLLNSILRSDEREIAKALERQAIRLAQLPYLTSEIVILCRQLPGIAARQWQLAKQGQTFNALAK